MASQVSDSESWRRIVLGSMPPAAWLASDGSHRDVVLSTRFRVMRNLAGHRFPSSAGPDELRTIKKSVLSAASSADRRLAPDGSVRNRGSRVDVYEAISPAERQFLIGSRLLSPDFEWRAPGRALLLDRARSVSLMVNEEDHLRLQAITAAWSPESAQASASSSLGTLESGLEFAYSPRFGYLAASPYNAGIGVRVSAMFHLVGLAHTGRLPTVLEALANRGMASRGLFGEASRAVGAYVQVSSTTGHREDFAGAGSYLVEEERSARASVPPDEVAERARAAALHAQSSRTVSLSEAFRVLSWIRWAASVRGSGFPTGLRELDGWWAQMELRSSGDEAVAARQRAEFLRERLGV